MGRRWVEPALMVVAVLSVVGAVRSVVVVTPAPGDLPEPLRSEGPRLAGTRSLREATEPPRRGRDQSWGPTHRFRLVPKEGTPVRVEMVVLRSRTLESVALPEWKGARTLTPGPNEVVRLGRKGNEEVLQSCLVGQGPGMEAAALVEEKDLAKAINNRQKLYRPADKIARLRWIAANEAGLGKSEGLECLLVSLKVERDTSSGGEGVPKVLLDAWKRLAPELMGWEGEL